MPNESLKTAIQVKNTVNLRARLLGRLKAVNVISLPESEFAKFLQDLEGDPLFGKLFHSDKKQSRVIRRDPWPTARLHQGFYRRRPAPGLPRLGKMEGLWRLQL